MKSADLYRQAPFGAKMLFKAFRSQLTPLHDDDEVRCARIERDDRSEKIVRSQGNLGPLLDGKDVPQSGN